MHQVTRFLLLMPAMLSAQSAPRTLPVTRELRIDGTAADLSMVASLTVSRDGSIVVSQPQDNLLRFFTATGQAAGTFGRKGDGPGEFQMIGRVGWVGDTIWVNDGRHQTTTFISPKRTLLRMTRFPAGFRQSASDTMTFGSVGGISPQAIFPGGEFLHYFLANPRNQRPTWSQNAAGEKPLIRISSSGVMQRTVAMYLGAESAECTKQVQSGNSMALVTLPFCASPLHAIASNGSAIAVLTQRNAPTSGAATYRIVAVNGKGDTLFAKTFPYQAVAVTRQEADSLNRKRMEGATALILEALSGLPPLPTHPPVRELRAGLDGTIWVLLFRRAAGHEWMILDAKGNDVGHVTLPGSTKLLEANRNTIWGVELDADDMPSVVRYRVGT